MGQWKDLPSEIIELVIAKLPIADIFRVQTTNTHMYELVKRMLHNNNSPQLSLRSQGETTSFLNGQLMIPGEPIDNALGTPFTNKPLVFDPETKAWNVKLPQLSSYLPTSRHRENVTVFAGNGGLLLLGVSARHPMVVCNPLTKCWRDLPLIPTGLLHSKLSKLFMVVMVDKSKKSYKVALFTMSALFTESGKCCSVVYTPERLKWQYKEHDNGDLPNKHFLHVTVDDVNPNLAHALVFDMRQPEEVEFMTFDAEAMKWTPWGFNDALVPNHPSCVAIVHTLLVQDGVVYVVVAQSVSAPTDLRGVYTAGTWMTILRLERHARSKPTARKLTETYFDGKYYECFRRVTPGKQPWFMWKSKSRRVISKICGDEIVEYDIVGGTWSRHQAQAAGANLTQVGYEECWMSV